MIHCASEMNERGEFWIQKCLFYIPRCEGQRRQRKESDPLQENALTGSDIERVIVQAGKDEIDCYPARSYESSKERD